MNDDECLYCGKTIWWLENRKQWVHLDTKLVCCPPTTMATPRTARLR